MRLPIHQAVLHVAPKFLAEEITAFSPELAAARRSDQVHYEKFPTHPWRRLEQSLAPFEKRILRVRETCHEDYNESRFLRHGQRGVYVFASDGWMIELESSGQ